MFAEFLLATALLQTPLPVATILDSAGWDYTPAMISAASVDHFVVCLDMQPCNQLTLTAAKHPTEGPNAYFWKLPNMPNGTHQLSIVACNQIVCGDPTDINFTFTNTVVPGRVLNPRLIRG